MLYCCDVFSVVLCCDFGVFVFYLNNKCACFFFQAEDGIRDLVRSRGLGDVYKRQLPFFGAFQNALRAGVIVAGWVYEDGRVEIRAVYALSLIHI